MRKSLKLIISLTSIFSITISLLILPNGVSANQKDPYPQEESSVPETILSEFDLNSLETQEKQVVLPSGETATFGISPDFNTSLRASNGTYKAYWYTGVANASFKFTVKGNKITKAYDKSYFFLGASLKSNTLKLDNSKQATLYFEFTRPVYDFGGWNGWLRAKINSNNKIVYSVK